MRETKKPWWYPKPVNAETVQRLRNDYPDETEEMDDDAVLENYELAGCRYQWLWDHTGDAAEQADNLADEIFRLRKVLKWWIATKKRVPWNEISDEDLDKNIETVANMIGED